MRQALTIALLLLTGCTSLDVATTFLKCGGMGGEQNFSICSWRKTSVFVGLFRSEKTPDALLCKPLVAISVIKVLERPTKCIVMSLDEQFAVTTEADCAGLILGHPYCAMWRASSTP
jgi:hypothetical protein